MAKCEKRYPTQPVPPIEIVLTMTPREAEVVAAQLGLGNIVCAVIARDIREALES